MYYKLLYLFPDLQRNEFFLQDDGQGAYIKEWKRPEPQPTQAELDVVTPAQEQEAKDKTPAAKAAKAKGRLKIRGTGAITRQEFNDLLDSLRI